MHIICNLRSCINMYRNTVYAFQISLEKTRVPCFTCVTCLYTKKPHRFNSARVEFIFIKNTHRTPSPRTSISSLLFFCLHFRVAPKSIKHGAEHSAQQIIIMHSTPVIHTQPALFSILFQFTPSPAASR